VKPYYDKNGITIYHGDCRDILPHLPKVDAVITDPIWPNAETSLPGSGNAETLYAEMISNLVDAERVVIQLGCDCDPQMLAVTTKRWPFFRVCWLEYACPSYKGRILWTGDVAYVYGKPPSTEVCRVVPGRCISTKSDKLFRRGTKRNKERSGDADSLPHPAPRRLQHVQWLVGWLSEGLILDPFAGSGTTLLAAKNANRPAIGIEIEEKYCEIAAKRLSQEVFDF